jgi:hypothetical protein
MKTNFSEFSDSQWEVIEKILRDRTGGPEKETQTQSAKYP